MRKALVLTTTFLFFLALIAMKIAQAHRDPRPIEVTSQVFGDPEAPVEVLLFEYFKCSGCHLFSVNILPQILSDYVLLNKARLKIVPLGFLHESKVLANAALEVSQLSPEQFFSYAKRLFEHFELREMNESTGTVLLDLAREVGGIDLKKLKLCIEQKCHYLELEHNLEQARSLMGNAFLVPALYVNGIRINTTEYAAIRKAIEEAQL